MHKNYKGCGTCAHANGVPKGQNFFCKVWSCNFLKTQNCEYYLRFDEPLNPFDKIQTPSERELDLIHFQRGCHFENMTTAERLKFDRFHEWYKKAFAKGFSNLILKKNG